MTSLEARTLERQATAAKRQAAEKAFTQLVYRGVPYTRTTQK